MSSQASFSRVLSLFYKLASTLLLPSKYYSTQELETLASELERALAEARELEAACPGFYHNLEKLVTSVKDSNSLDEYQVDMTSTMVASYGHVPCPPYESIYRVNVGRRRKMIALPGVTGRLNNFYRRLGLELKWSPTITEDHVSTELEFLSILHSLISRAEDREIVEEARRIRSEYLNHLRGWLPDFLECLRANGRSSTLLLLADTLMKGLECEALLL